MAKGNQPAATFRIGLVKATVWKNSGSGDREFYSTVLTRSYKEDDDWKETDQLGHSDLLSAARLLQRCEDFIAEQK